MRLIAVVACVLGACSSTPAHAADVSITASTTVTYAAAAGEANGLTAAVQGGNLVFTDPSGVTPGAGCVDDAGADPAVAVCPRGGIVSLLVALGDQADDLTLNAIPASITVTVYAGSGDDVLRGSTGMATTYMFGFGGRDTYVGGAGVDWVSYGERGGGVTASLDDVANDPDGENLPSEIEALDGSTGDDTLIGSDGEDRLYGNEGADTLLGGAGADSLTGGPGGDRLEGGDDDDLFPIGEPGADDVRGGAGIDRFTASVSDYDSGEPRDVRISLDDVANDGSRFEQDNVHSDVEDVSAATVNGALGTATLAGNERFNVLSGGVGADTIDGGRGADQLNGFGGADTIEARDGEPDRVDCGPAVDRAFVDQYDEVANCESVTRQVAPGPPAATPTPTPPAAEPLVRQQPPPPARLLPTLRFRVTPGRDRRAPYRFRVLGGVVLPRTVSAQQGCDEGLVSVQVKRGARTISPRRVGLKPDCGFSSTVSFARRLRGRLTVTVRFLGNAALVPRSARPVVVRAG